MMNRKAKKAWFGLVFIGLIAAITGVFMLLWNALVPVLFNGVVITFWQALGLLVMAKLLFGGLGGLFSHAHQHHHQEQYKEMNKFHAMSREERKEYIRRHFKDGHDHWFEKETPADGDEIEK